jgi:hypothetical protein
MAILSSADTSEWRKALRARQMSEAVSRVIVRNIKILAKTKVKVDLKLEIIQLLQKIFLI